MYLLPHNMIVNADDFGMSESINSAILRCYQTGLINSSSLLCNFPAFEKAVTMIHRNEMIQGVGVHVNLCEGKPLRFDNYKYLNNDGSWNQENVSRVFDSLDARAKYAFADEIEAQITKILTAGINLTHIDSHCHIHTLPKFHKLFSKIAGSYNLKLRIAQTFYEGNALKYLYRLYINHKLKKRGRHYTEIFGAVDRFNNFDRFIDSKYQIEVMLHPDLNSNSNIIDHFEPGHMKAWMAFVDRYNQQKSGDLQ